MPHACLHRIFCAASMRPAKWFAALIFSWCVFGVRAGTDASAGLPRPDGSTGTGRVTVRGIGYVRAPRCPDAEEDGLRSLSLCIGS